MTPVINELMDISYPMAADCPEIDSIIDHRIDQLIKQCFTSAQHPPTPTVGQVIVLFSYKDPSKTKKKSGWFGHVKEQASDDLPMWEKWIVNVNCLPVSGDARNLSDGNGLMNNAERLLHLSAASFESNLFRILDVVDKHKNHIPPILNLDVAPFPFTISISSPNTPVNASEDETWGHYIKKIID